MSDLLLKPMPGIILVQRIHKKEKTKAGVYVPRRDQEETSAARIIHPGWFQNEFVQGDLVLVEPHSGTDFFWEDGDTEFTLLPVERILATCKGKGPVEWA